jgi:hypothetical protein
MDKTPPQTEYEDPPRSTYEGGTDGTLVIPQSEGDDQGEIIQIR